MSSANSTTVKVPHNLRVFISHVHEDNNLCQTLLIALDAWGVDRWFDDESLRAGDAISKEIYQAIGEREVFIRICTAAMQRRPRWVDIEAHLFQGIAAQDNGSIYQNKRKMISLILDTGFRLDQFCRDHRYLDTVNKEPRVWLRELREALGLVVGMQAQHYEGAESSSVAALPETFSGPVTVALNVLDTPREVQTIWDTAQLATVRLSPPPAGTPILEIQTSDYRPPMFGLPEGELFVGRTEESTVALYDVAVSRRHAKVLRDEDNRCTIFDLASTNGTYVNGERVGPQGRRLRDGDAIQVGQTLLRYRDT